MLNNFSDEQLRLVARLYYVDGLSQKEVAKFVKGSQAKVSRLLTAARERRIVRFTVDEYVQRNEPLEAELRSRLGLDAAAVIKTLEGATPETARRTVANFGAPFVTALIPARSVVAIAGGRTIQEMVHLLPEDRERGCTIVQAMGSIDSQISAVDAFELARNMARRWGGFFVTLNTPAFVPDKKTRDSLLALNQIQSVWKYFAQANTALVGVGTLENSVFVEREVVGAADLEKLKKQGAVGEICGRFFDQDGRECDSPWRDHVLSIELETLRKIPQVISLVAGADRAPAILAAIRGGLIKSLAIDEIGAAALLQSKKTASIGKSRALKRAKRTA